MKMHFHHVGMACRKIAAELSELALVGYSLEGPQIEDPIQQVRIQFVTGGGPRLELIEPASAQSPVHGVLKRGSKFYHLAYEVDQLETAVDYFASRKFFPIAPPAPATAFGMRRIVFLTSETFTLIELIEGPLRKL
jgi:methylmalonyl-CoA/ethylmalonyl-CoA epimerase